MGGAGIGSILAGLVQSLTGKPTVASLILTIIGPTVIALWMLAIGVLPWRRSARQGGQHIAQILS
jgi:hypothetical protein